MEHILLDKLCIEIQKPHSMAASVQVHRNKICLFFFFLQHSFYCLGKTAYLLNCEMKNVNEKMMIQFNHTIILKKCLPYFNVRPLLLPGSFLLAQK